MTQAITYYADDDVLVEFYKAIANRDEVILRRIHIPRSDVFYVREVVQNALGGTFTLDRIERAMYLEGMLDAEDCFEPERQREWE